MELVLFERRDDELWCTITARLVDGKLSISGHDLGPHVKRMLGEDEYEYARSLNEENTEKLFQELGCPDASDEEKLAKIKAVFPNDRADSALGEFCEEHGIESSFWSWL